MSTTEHFSPRRSAVQPTLLLSAGRHVRVVDPTEPEDVCLGVIAMATARTVRIRLVDAFPGDWVRGHTVKIEMLSDVDRAQQPGLRGLLVWAALARRSSQRTERALPDRLPVRRFDAVADAWFAWRIARRATIGRFRLN